MAKSSTIGWLLFIISIALYVVLGYFTPRHNTVQLLLCFTVLFVAYAYVSRHDREHTSFWLGAGIFFRCLLLFSVPSLSDDVYRFVWDGRLLDLGYHPFAEVPSFYIEQSAGVHIDSALYEKLNSKHYFTIYPPVAQVIFWLSAVVSPDSVYGSIVVMKLILLGCELGTLYFMIRILERLGINPSNVLWYALNPLVILELAGNVHFEAVMIFFLTGALWWIMQRRHTLGAIFLACSIGVKLLPLMLLPMLVNMMGWKKGVGYGALTLFFVLIFFIPLYSPEIIDGFRNSIAYYFQKFEFNASVYYLVREWGYWYYGYNIIQTMGWKLGVLAGIIILVIAFFPTKGTEKREAILFHNIMWSFLIFLLLTTTVHPWYVIPVVALSIFTSYRFAVIWSALVFFTYAGYSNDGFFENKLVVIAEYLIVLGYLAYELWMQKKHYSLFSTGIQNPAR